MRQVLQNLVNRRNSTLEAPAPAVSTGKVLIQSKNASYLYRN